MLNGTDLSDLLGVPVGYQSFMPEERPLESIDFVRSLGLNLIEFNSNMPWFFPERFGAGLRADLREKARAAGVTLAIHAPEEISFVSPHPGLVRAGVERTRDYIDLASDLGAEVLTCHLGGNYLRWASGEARVLLPHHLYPENMRESLLASLPGLARRASESGVKLSMENAGCFEPTVIQKMVSEAMELSPLHLTWDVGHSNTRDGRLEEHERFVFSRLDRLALIHMHDNDGLVDTHSPLGTGSLDVSRTISVARKAKAPISIEVRPRSLIARCAAVLRDAASPARGH